MKEFLAVILLVGCAVAEPPAPYAPSGWRPSGPSFNIPQRAQSPQEYLPPLDPRNPATPNVDYGVPEEDVSVQGLPAQEEVPYFQTSPINGQQTVGAGFKNDIRNLDQGFKQSQYQQQQQTYRNFDRQRQIDAQNMGNILPKVQPPGPFARTTPAPTEATSTFEPTTTELNLNEGETLDAPKAAKVTVEVSKQKIQEYPGELFLSSLAQLQLQPQFLPLQQFGQIRAPLVVQGQSQKQGYDAQTHFAALPSILAQQQKASPEYQNPALLIAPQQPQPVAQYQPVNYQPQLQTEQVNVQPQPAAQYQPVNYQPQLQTEQVNLQPQSAAQYQPVNYQPQLQTEQVNLQPQPAAQYQPVNYQPQLQSEPMALQPQPVAQYQPVNYQPQLQSEPVNLQPQPVTQYQPVNYQPQQLQPVTQYQPQPQLQSEIPLQYQPVNSYQQPNLQPQMIYAQPNTLPLPVNYQPQLQFPQPQAAGQPRPNNPDAEPIDNQYQQRFLPQPNQYQPQPSLIQAQPIIFGSQQDSLQSGLDVNQQGNDIQEDDESEEQDEGTKATAVATAFGTRTQPRVFTQYGAPFPVPKVQANPGYTTTESPVEDITEDAPIVAQAVAVADGSSRKKSARLRSRRVRPLFTLDRSGHLVLAQGQ